MSDESPLRRSPSAPLGGRYDRLAAYGLLLLAVAMSPLRFVMSHLYATTFPIVIGVAGVLAVLAMRGDARESYPFRTLGSDGGVLVASLTVVVIAIMVLVAAVSGQRMLLFYGLAGVAGTLLLAQPLFVDERAFRPGLVVGQTLLLGLVVRFAALYTTPGVVGVDPWSHVSFIQSVQSVRSVTAIESKYVAAPLYHLLATFLAMAADISARNAIYLSVGVTYTVLLLFVYPTARILTTERWASVALVLYVVSDQTIRWGITLIPTTTAVGLFLAALFLLVRVLADEPTARDIALLSFCIVGVTLTHQVSSFVMLMTLCATLAASLLVAFDRLFPSASGTQVLGLVGFNGGLIILVWSVTPYLDGTFTTVMLERVVEAVSGAGLFENTTSAKNVASQAGGAGAESVLTQVVAYLDVLPFLLLLCLGLLGAAYVLRSNRLTHTRLTALFAISVMAVFALGLPILGVSTFVPGRWYAFMYALLAIVGALGLGHLAYNADARVTFAVVAVLLVVFPAVSVVAPSATPDNPLVDSQQVRKGYTEQEVTAVRTIAATTTSDSPVRYTDDPYRSVFRRTGTARVGKMIVPANGTPPHDVVVYREYQTHGAPLLFTRNRTSKLEQVSRARVCPPGRSVVYRNGDVAVCIQPG